MRKGVILRTMKKKDLTAPLSQFLSPVRTTIRVGHTVEKALCELRSKQITDQIMYIYVVDLESALVGVVSTRCLLLADPQTPIVNLMSSHLISLKENQTLQDAMELLETCHLLAVPVVDHQNRLMGVVDVGLYLEEKVDVGTERQRADIFQILGMSVEEGKKKGVWKGYLSRMPWIFCNLFGGVACAVISRIFEIVLAKVLLLAMFIPLVLTLSESIAMQSMTQSMQLLRKSRRTWSYTFQSLFREWWIVTLLGISSGCIVGAVSLLWGDGFLPGAVIFSAIACCVSITAIVGSIVPLVIYAQKWDPRVAAGPVVLMFADVFTTLVYLSIGTWWLV